MNPAPQHAPGNRLSLLLICCAMLAATPVQAAGILVPSGENNALAEPALRITDHLVNARIQNGIALTTINQTFENLTDQRLEATYLFPIPENAEITDFQMTFNGKMVPGEVLPADQARKIYADIVRRQRDPGLIEFIGRRLLKARIFPIEPYSKTEIQLRYQQIIDRVSGMSRYHYPLRTPAANGRASGTVRFSIELETAAPLKAVWSPTHQVAVVRLGEKRARVAYEKSGASLAEDFLLLFDTADQAVGMSLVAHRPPDAPAGHFLLILSPQTLWEKNSAIPQDYVFVVDTSGSMAGEKIDQAKNALAYCVKRLEAEDRFSIIRFSTGFDLLFPTLQKADANAKTTALAAIENFNAAGGTNIFSALQQALALPDNPTASARPFIIIFLTDGLGERRREEIEKMIAEQTPESKRNLRIFPFGIGHDVNTKLLDSLAVNYGGIPTYVQPGENLELRLGDFFAVFSEPALTEVKITLPNASEITERFPPTSGDLYHGRQLILTGQFKYPVTGSVVLTARRGTQLIRYEWANVALKSTADADYVSRIWAGRKLAYLLDRIRLHGESDELVTAVVRLATRWGIQTPYTSWLVTPEDRNESDTPFELTERRRGIAPATRKALAELSAEEPDFWFQSNATTENYPEAPALLELDDESGARAVQVAKTLRSLRAGTSLDAAASNTRGLRLRHLGGRNYWNLPGALVDQELNENTETLTVKFGSAAYFEIALKRPDLRKVLAEAKSVIVLVNENFAIFIHPTKGLTELTTKIRNQLW